MSRGIGTTNEGQVDASHLHEVLLVLLDFDTPVYVHSGIGTITYNGNDYIGVGHLGGISELRESEVLGPSQIALSLDAQTANNVTEALDAGNLYDPVTIYFGYRNDDGTLVGDPWIAWSGWFEYATISLDTESSVEVVCQHDLAVLDENNGGRYSDEDQQDRYTGDVGFEFATSTVGVKLLWGGRPVSGGGPGTVPTKKETGT